MKDPVAPKPLPERSRSGPLQGDSPNAGTPRISLFEYLALREVPWNLAYVCFLIYFVVITTYIANIGVEAMALALLALFLGSRRPRWPFPVWLFLMFWLWAALSTVLSRYAGDFEPLIELGKVFLIFLVAVNVLWHRLGLRLFLLLFLACFTLFPVRGTLFNYFLYDNADFGRPGWVWLFRNPNDMAALTILALALAAGFLHKETPRMLRFAAQLLCPLFAFIVLLTQSRGAFIGLCVFLLFSLWSIGQNRMRAILTISIIATIVIATVPQAVWERIAGLENATSEETIAEMDSSAVERWEIAKTALNINADNPIVGVGIRRSQVAHGIYNPRIGSKNLHDTYLEVLVETGIPGLVLFLWLILSLLLRAWSVRRKVVTLRDTADWRRLQLIEFGMYGYLVAGIWGTYGYISLFYVFLAVLFAQTNALETLGQEVTDGSIASKTAMARV